MIYYIESTQLFTEYAEKLWSLSESAYLHGAPWTKAQFLADLNQKISHYLILANEKEWIGFISYQLLVDEVDITHVVVNNKFQQQGYASRLIDHLMDDFKNKQISRVFLEVRCSNKKAQNLYHKKGFEPVGKRKKYYHQPTEDGIVMRLVLGDVHQ